MDADVCTCCTTSVVETAAGPIAAYRDHQGGVRDISVVRYLDGRWTPPSTVHRDNWEIDGCPTNGPVLAARGSDVNPLDDADLEEKLRTVAAGWDPGYDTRPLIDAIWALDKSADVSGLVALTVPHP